LIVHTVAKLINELFVVPLVSMSPSECFMLLTTSCCSLVPLTNGSLP
jgi:hypothetical protein